MNTVESDVLIIGGGVAGALIADSLTKAGTRVVVVEAGAKVDRIEATRQWAAAGRKSPGSPYTTKDGQQWAPFPDSETDYNYKNSGDGPFKSFYIRRQGGSTLAWQGSSPRFIPADFRLRQEFGRGVDWPISYDDLEAWYCRAETILRVAGNHDEWNGFYGGYRSQPFPLSATPQTFSDLCFKKRTDGLVINGVRATVRSTPQARNNSCLGAASCIPICPIGAKYDATRHLNQLETAKSVTVDYTTVATNLIIEAGKAVGARAVCWNGASPTETIYRARHIVVACHAIESARLLLASNVMDRSGMIGCNLMDHPTGQLAGLSPEPWFPFRSPPVTSGIDDWRNGSFRRDQSAWKLSLGNDGLGRLKKPHEMVSEWLDAGLFGDCLGKKAYEEATRWFRISWATEQLPDTANRVSLTGKKDSLGVPLVELSYRVDDYTLRSYPLIRLSVRELFRAAGVTEFANQDPPAGQEVFGGSGHIMGTTKMGAIAEESVVDSSCRMHLHPELWVVGASVFPSSGTANPTLTIAALALRAAYDIQQELHKVLV